MLSRYAWTDLLKKSHVAHPFILEFPHYSKEDILDIVSLDCPTDEDPRFYKNFARMMYETIHRPCKNLSELRHLVSLVFPKYLEPVKKGLATREQTSKLIGHVSNYLKTSTEGILLRQISSSEWNRKEYDLKAFKSFHFELPYYTKLVLIASFLASFNPPKYDTRFFSKGKEDRKFSRGRKASKKVREKSF
jgi:origin recognition complex subunit 5